MTCTEIVCRPTNDCRSTETLTNIDSDSRRDVSVSSYIIVCPMFTNLEREKKDEDWYVMGNVTSCTGQNTCYGGGLLQRGMCCYRREIPDDAIAPLP